MHKQVLTKIRTKAQEKQTALQDWLETCEPEEKQVILNGADAQALLPHLAVLEETIAKVDDETLGVCVICHGEIEDDLLEMDYTAQVCLDDLSEPDRRQLEAELEFSSEVQRALLPQHAPAIPGLGVGAFSRPAQIIGGDYFDFFTFKGGSYGLAIADVSGHGVSASLLMSTLQTALRTLASGTNSVAEVVQRINDYYLHNVNLTTFITLFVAQYDPEKRLLTYANAGHNPPLLLRRDQLESPVWLCPTGAAVGLLEQYPLDSETVNLAPEDVLLLYTDGVTELSNLENQFFGTERLAGRVAAHASLPPQELVSELRKDLDAFHGVGSPADDVTMVAVKALG